MRALTNKITRLSASLDGVNGSHIDVASAANDVTAIGADGTIEFWMKPDKSHLTSGGTLFSFQVADNLSDDFFLCYYGQATNGISSEVVYFATKKAGVTKTRYFADSNDVYAGAWIHVAFVTTGTVLSKIYINGTEQAASGDIYGMTDAIGGLTLGYLGGRKNGVNFDHVFPGSLTEFRIWDYARSEEQIKANMNDSVQPQTGLVGYWKLVGNATDLSGNSNHGTVNGGVVWATDYPAALPDKKPLTTGLTGSADFDGVSDIGVPDVPTLNPTTSITMECWVNLRSITTHNTFYRKGIQYFIRSYGSAYQAYLYIGGSVKSVSFNGAEVNKWTHIAATYDGGNFILYVNGEPKAATALTGNIDVVAENLKIGSYRSNDLFMEGKLANARIWNKALSPSEIKNGMYTAYPAGTSGLIEQWTLNGNANGTNGNHGTVQGGVTFTPEAPRRLLTSKQKQPYMLSSDGSGFAKIPNSFVKDLRLVTIEMVVRISSSMSGYLYGSHNDTHGMSCNMGTGGGGIFNVRLDPATTTDTNQSSMSFTSPRDVFFRLVLVKTSTRMAVYINGVANNSVDYAGEIQMGSHNINLLSYSGTSHFLKGDIALFRLWDIGKTDQAIKDLEKGIDNDRANLRAEYIPDRYETKLLDTSGKGNNGEIISPVVLKPSSAPVGQRSSLYFDGGNDSVNCGTSVGNMGVNDLTVTFWIKTSFNSIVKGIASKGAATAADKRYAVFLENGKIRGFMCGFSVDGDRSTYSTTIVSDNNWHHVSVVYDRSGLMYLYVDGFQESSVDISLWSSVNMDSAFPFMIGSYTNGDGITPNYFFPGLISSLALHSASLTASEIKTNMHQYLPSDTPNLLEQWKLDEGAGIVAYGTKGINGAITGATWKEGTVANWKAGHVKLDRLISTEINVKVDNTLVIQENLRQQWTIEAWVRVTSGTTDTVYLTPDVNLGLRLAQAGGRSLLYINSGTDDYYVYGGDIRDGLWHHIAFVFNNQKGRAEIYIDGALSSSTVVNKTSTPKGQFATLRLGYGGNCDIDELRIWNYDRTQAEIQENMNRTLDRQPGLVGNWRFDHDNYYDASGYGNHGTPVNGPVIEDNNNDKLIYNAPIN